MLKLELVTTNVQSCKLPILSYVKPYECKGSNYANMYQNIVIIIS